MRNRLKTNKILRYISAVFLIGFGLLTLFLSASIILDLFGIRAKQGNYVLFIVWTNFISSMLYLCAAYGFLKSKNWTRLLLGLATIILIVSFISLKVYVQNGGIYETRTVDAMLFRIGVTVVFTLVAFFTIQQHKTGILSKS